MINGIPGPPSRVRHDEATRPKEHLSPIDHWQAFAKQAKSQNFPLTRRVMTDSPFPA
jgi:hypothetical protein